MFVDVPAPHGRLEGVFWQVPRARAAAVVLHPHPQLGGTMHHHAPYRLSRALRDVAVTTLRFNFRGVGRSTGSYAEGEGEQEDVRAGLQFLAEKAPELPLWICGFSFGAWVGLHVAADDPRIQASLVAGVPVRLFDHAFVSRISAPLAAIQGELDEFGAPADVRALLDSARGPTKLTVLDRADHMFSAHLDALEAAARESAGFLRGPAAPTIAG